MTGYGHQPDTPPTTREITRRKAVWKTTNRRKSAYLLLSFSLLLFFLIPPAVGVGESGNTGGDDGFDWGAFLTELITQRRPVELMDARELRVEGDKAAKECEVRLPAVQNKITAHLLKLSGGTSIPEGSWLPKNDPKSAELESELEIATNYCNNAVKYYNLGVTRAKSDDYGTQATLLERKADLFEALYPHTSIRDEAPETLRSRATTLRSRTGSSSEPANPGIAGSPCTSPAFKLISTLLSEDSDAEGKSGIDPDHCYQAIAVQLGDTSLCSSIRRGAPMTKCYLLIAAKKNDPGICSQMPSTTDPQGYLEIDCLWEVGTKNNNPEACRAIGTASIGRMGIGEMNTKTCLAKIGGGGSTP